MTNYGIKQTKPRKTDWVAGGETGIQYKENTNGDWTPYLPKDEKQGGSIDSLGCVSFSALNCIETQLKYLINKNQVPSATIDWLNDNGYYDGLEINFSDRFLAKMSGTQALHGNWPPAVWETIRTCGLLPEQDWPSDFSTYENYYAEVPAALQAKAKEFLKYFSIKYQWIVNGPQLNDNGVKGAIGLYLKQSPLQTCSPVCPSWWSPLVIPCGKRSADHATMIYRIVKDVAIYIFDHYSSFRKVLSYLYPTDFVMQGIIEPLVVVAPVVPHHQFNINLNYGIRNYSKEKDRSKWTIHCQEVAYLQDCLSYLGLLKPNLSTGNYFELTRIAVKAFLVKYKVTSAWNIYWNAGKFVGTLTRTKLNQMFP